MNSIYSSIFCNSPLYLSLKPERPNISTIVLCPLPIIPGSAPVSDYACWTIICQHSWATRGAWWTKLVVIIRMDREFNFCKIMKNSFIVAHVKPNKCDLERSSRPRILIKPSQTIFFLVGGAPAALKSPPLMKQ